MEQRQFSRKLKWKSRGDLKLNSDIQERALRFEARSSYYVVMPLWHLSSEQTEDKIQNDGEHNANYDAGYYGEEELKTPLLQKYVAWEFS
jgi:hypothetical protein